PTCPDFIAAVEENRIMAVVVVATLSHSKWAKPLHKRGVPIIGESGTPTQVMPEYARMNREAVDYLNNHGRKNIALMEWYDSQTTHEHGKEINQAFEQQMDIHGLQVHKKWIRRDLPAPDVGAGWADFREIWAASKNKRPDGLIITDDILFRDAA